MIFHRVLSMVLLLVGSTLLNAQEVKYIDLTSIHQRTELRHPSNPVDCEEGEPCHGSGRGGGSIADASADPKDPRALGVYLERVTPTDINPAQPFEAEFRVFNSGIVPLEIPISPHLSDLQPSDEFTSFSYCSLALAIEVRGMPDEPELVTTGFVVLYGSADHDGTMLPLRPGEWVRVKAKVTLLSSPQKPISARFRGGFWLRTNTFHPRVGGAYTETKNLYPNQTPTPWLGVRLLPVSK